MKPLAADTDPDVEARIVAGWRACSPAEKFRAALELIRASESWCRHGLRARHPDADDSELDRRLLELKYGRELVRGAPGPRA